MGAAAVGAGADENGPNGERGRMRRAVRAATVLVAWCGGLALLATTIAVYQFWRIHWSLQLLFCFEAIVVVLDACILLRKHYLLLSDAEVNAWEDRYVSPQGVCMCVCVCESVVLARVGGYVCLLWCGVDAVLV